jgi:3-methylfumaryl-CoA hydratase
MSPAEGGIPTGSGTPDLTAWVGREEVAEELLDPFPARGMAALLDRDPQAFVPGVPLPPGWHWLHFKPLVPRSQLGPDGHERLGSFLPPVPLGRRMWAGGTLEFPGELRVGDRARRISTVASVVEKEGRSGRLVFVTVRHRVDTERGPGVEETQDIVYREGPSPGAPPSGAPPAPPSGEPPAPPPGGPAPPDSPDWSEPFTADAVDLFRYSALTFNGHRIHYDPEWATGVEGFPGLVVHGPLLATLLLDGAIRHVRHRLHRFEYRAVSPLFAGEPFRVEGRVGPEGPAGPEPPGAPGASGASGASRASEVAGVGNSSPSEAFPQTGNPSPLALWVVGPRGVAMQATATFRPGS